jgi:hypothetical protein
MPTFSTMKQIQAKGLEPRSNFFSKDTMRFFGDKLSNYKIRPNILDKIRQKYSNDDRVVACIERIAVGNDNLKETIGNLYFFDDLGVVIWPVGWPDHVTKV